MKHYIAILMLAIVCKPSLAADHGSAGEAIALVHKVIAAMKANGRGKTLDDINHGKYMQKDLYITVTDASGVSVANSVNPKIVGKNLLGIRDADGKAFMLEGAELIKAKGKGWINFRWPNPASGKIESKSTYVEQYNDLAIACGIYKGE